MHTFVESPFSYRNNCWFCNEPAGKIFCFPQADNHIVNYTHPPLSLRCCHECYSVAIKSDGRSIWNVLASVKRFIIQKYQKDLAIGLNWTQEELENSEFEHGNFEGFKRSAWFMYEVAKGRVNFTGWPLIINGLNIDEYQCSDGENFTFDGVVYPSCEDAIIHYAKAFDLHLTFFRKVLAHVGLERFSFAVRFCRLLVDSTPDERESAFKEIT